jgi:ABC-type lipoprotein release transport system permease subunit
LIWLCSYVIAFVTTLLPARRAARLHPAEALRYE